MAEIQNNFEYHHYLQNDFYLKDNLNQMLVAFLIYFQQAHALFCWS